MMSAMLFLANTSSLTAQAIAAATHDMPREMTDNIRVSVDMTNAPLADVLQAIARQAGLFVSWDTQRVDVQVRVSLHVQGAAVRDAVAKATAGTAVRADIVARRLVLSRNDAALAIVSGVITGTVVDAKTKQPVRGAMVALDDARTGVTTDEAGAFRISGVSAGAHALHVRKLSYGKRTQAVTVVDGEQASVTIALTPSVNALDQVVVTGTVVATELKAIPNAITVITGKELEERGVSRIYELFHGAVPGLFTNRTGQAGAVDPGRIAVVSRGSTQMFVGGYEGVASYNEGIKTYVDGVELADKSYLGMIDPKSIERIEILTGPQASTIYGSGAINGVMQIFTKRGTTARPQITATLQNAWTQNNFSAGLAPTRDASSSVTGVEGHISYNTGASWQQVGSWSPSVNTQTVSGYGGAKITAGPLTTDVSLRANQVRNRSGGTDNQAFVERAAAGISGSSLGLAGIGIPNQLVNSATDVAAGVTETYVATPWWSHVVTLGLDHLGSVHQKVNQTYINPADTSYYLLRFSNQRLTGAYNTTMQVPMTSLARFVVTVGGDVSHLTSDQVEGSYILSGFGQYLPTSPNGGINVTHSRAPGHGGFLTSQFGVRDALFFTYGLRAEYNPNVGKNQNPNLQPRYGVALTQTVGEVTVKLRGSYGHSTRPPSTGVAEATRLSALSAYLVSLYGDTVFVFANPNLLPVQQRGGEGGVELYLGNRASLVVTRYNQTVDDLIQEAVVDSVDVLPEQRALNGWYPWQERLQQAQFLNLGSVRNQGWELTGTFNVGPFTTRGSYSWTKSRLIGITPRYRSQFPSYVPGSTFAEIPEHTYGAEIAYAHGGTRVAYDLQGQGAVLSSWTVLHFISQDQRLQSNMPLAMFRDYSLLYGGYQEMRPGYFLGDLNISRQFALQIEGLLQIHNVANSYRSEVISNIAQAGRTTNLGVRLRF